MRALRKHDHAVKRMAALLQEFGFKIPVLVRGTGEIVDGHLRVKAAASLGMTEIPVIVYDEWTEAQVKAFRLAVNRSSSFASWDLELVALEIGELKSMNFDLSLTGFDLDEIDRMFGNETESGESDSESCDESVTQPGDLWICGEHRVLCGDSTSMDAVARLLKGATPVLMVTDPPYGISLDPNWRERAGLGKLRQTDLTGLFVPVGLRDWNTERIEGAEKDIHGRADRGQTAPDRSTDGSRQDGVAGG